MHHFQILHPHWDRSAADTETRRRGDAEKLFRSHMHSRLTSALRPLPSDLCLYCRRPLALNERATCQHCDAQWRAFRRSQARTARWQRLTLLLALSISVVLCGSVLGELLWRLIHG